MGVGGTHLGVVCILLGSILLGFILLGFILLGFIPLGVVYFLPDPESFRDLVDLLQERECLFIHLVLETLEGLLGQARSTLLARVSSLLEVVLRGLALVSSLQGLVHLVLMDRGQTDQVRTDQGQMAQVRMDLVQMVQAQTDLAQTGLAPTGQVPMDLVQAANRLGVEATAKSRRSSPPQDTSAQLHHHLHHAPLHLKPSWQNVLR